MERAILSIQYFSLLSLESVIFDESRRKEQSLRENCYYSPTHPGAQQGLWVWNCLGNCPLCAAPAVRWGEP